jgi:tetratricopeptide (TPR) repeat protein
MGLSVRTFRKWLFSMLAPSVALALTGILASCQSTPRVVAEEDVASGTLKLELSQDTQSLLFPRLDLKAAEAARDALLKASTEGKAPVQAELLSTIAELSLLSRDYTQAKAAARARLKLNYNDTEAMNLLIRAELAQGKPKAALVLVDNALAVEPRNAITMNLRGLAFFQQGRLIEARESWKLSQKYDPTHIPSLMNLGALYYQNGNISLAGTMFERVLSLRNDHLDARVGLALVKFSQGDKDQAMGMLAQLNEANTGSPLVLYNLAIVERDGFQNFEVALTLMERFVEQSTKVTGARQAVERGLAQVQSLKAQIAANRQNLSDEELRSMAGAPGRETAQDGASGEPAVSASNASEAGPSVDKDVQSLEDAIK